MSKKVDKTVTEKVINEYIDLFEEIPYWMHQSNCIKEQVDPYEDALYIREQLCPSCPVKRDCLDWALKNNVQGLTFGGLDIGEKD